MLYGQAASDPRQSKVGGENLWREDLREELCRGYTLEQLPPKSAATDFRKPNSGRKNQRFGHKGPQAGDRFAALRRLRLCRLSLNGSALPDV